jgi:hypothetical protein
MMSDEIRIPDIEIIIGAAGDDIALFCFYKREDIHQGYDIVSGIPSTNALPVVRALLRDALTALDASDWYDVDGLREITALETDEPPF